MFAILSTYRLICVVFRFVLKRHVRRRKYFRCHIIAITPIRSILLQEYLARFPRMICSYWILSAYTTIVPSKIKMPLLHVPVFAVIGLSLYELDLIYLSFRRIILSNLHLLVALIW